MASHDAMAPHGGSPGEPLQRLADPDMDVFEQPAIGMPLALAAGGAVLGALLWAGIAYATGMEIGYVAWAIGGLVGGGMVLGGGRGVMHAGIAAALSLVGIFGGKLYGTQLLIEHELQKVEAAMFSRETFEGMRKMAQQMVDAPPAPSAEPGSMAAGEGFDYELTEQDRQQIQAAMAAESAQFARLLQPDYTFEQWRDDTRENLRSQVSAWSLLRENLDFLDVIFVLLGLSTAFGIVQKAGLREMT